MLDALVIDFETRSRCDLVAKGGHNYAADPSTDILCMAAYDLTTDQQWLWYPNQGVLPHDLVSAITARHFIAAHNAEFDQLIWEFVAVDSYGFPELPPEKWYCTAAQARVNAAPSSLDRASQFVTGKRLKMAEGKGLIKLLSLPNPDGTFNEDEDALRQMGEYCLQDVVATVAVIRATRLMTEQEHRDWLVTARVNEYGVKIDVELAEQAQQYAKQELEELAEELAELTDGAVTAVTQIQRIKKWALAQLDESIIKAHLTKTETHKKTGVTTTKTTFDKGARANLKRAIDRGEVTVTDALREVLNITEDGNKASVAKFKRMMDLADPVDHRVRGAYLYAGASQTKRFSAKGLQVHNFRRDVLTDAQVIEAKSRMKSNSLHLLDDTGVMDILSRLLRPALVPDTGRQFIVCDWSAIEARCLPWLSNSRGGERVLDVFREGNDIYLHTAAAMGIKERQIGKVATLALGYQGGVNAFTVMARLYGLELPESQTERIVRLWRQANEWAVELWAGLERAARKAISRPDTLREYGRVRYYYASGLMGGTLMCILPDESIIQYPYARIEVTETSWGEQRPSITFAKAALTPPAGGGKWPRTAIYGGLLAENCTQAVAASLLRDALRECLERGLDVALHVHDEIVVECDKSTTDLSMGVLSSIMTTPPRWARGLPLEAEPSVKARYGK